MITRSKELFSNKAFFEALGAYAARPGGGDLRAGERGPSVRQPARRRPQADGRGHADGGPGRPRAKEQLAMMDGLIAWIGRSARRRASCRSRW
ncbi:MAG: hypothetical protein R3F43_11285 [bacterium]